MILLTFYTSLHVFMQLFYFDPLIIRHLTNYHQAKMWPSVFLQIYQSIL